MSLPEVNSPSITLTTPSPSEQLEIWTATHAPWGPGLTLQQYIDREEYLVNIGLARNGGLSPWMLTTTDSPRSVLSSCETLRKRVIYRDPKTGTVKEVLGHGVASVFTYDQCRGKGYASKMMQLLGEHLAAQQAAKDGDAQLSVLYSDIGKNFYARSGWIPHGNVHFAIPVVDTQKIFQLPANVQEITDADIPALAKRDEELLRQEVAKPNGDKVRVAFLPDVDTWEWQYRREDFMRRHIHGRAPTVRGAVYTPADKPAARVWALWARTRYGGSEGYPYSNIMHFLRFVVEDEEAITDDELAEALKGIFAVANKESIEWGCTRIDMWNPSERVKKLVNGPLTDLKAGWVVRESDNIASLKWFGDERDEDIEWVANEKYVWC